MLVQFKTIEEIEKIPGVYFDNDDFWENKEKYDAWIRTGSNCCCTFFFAAGKTKDLYEMYKTDVKIEDLHWGIKEIYTKEKYPEYYL